MRSLGRSNSSLSMVFWYLLLVSIGSGALAMGDWQPVPVSDWGWLRSESGFTGALGQMWLTDAFRRAPPPVVGPFEYHGHSLGLRHRLDISWSAAPSLSLVVGACIVVV